MNFNGEFRSLGVLRERFLTSVNAIQLFGKGMNFMAISLGDYFLSCFYAKYTVSENVKWT